MSSKASATRYARALFDVVLQQSDVDKVERDMSALAALMTEHADLAAAFTSPRVPAAARASLAAAVAARVAVEAPVARLLALLADRGRLHLVPLVAAAYQARVLAHRQIVRAHVTAATPMTPAREGALRDRLSRATGSNVQIDVAVDPALIGGLVARIGSTVYDGSVRTQLHNVHRRLVAAQ